MTIWIAELISEPLFGGIVGVSGLTVSTVGLYITATQAKIAAEQAKRAADTAETSRIAVNKALARIDLESLLLDATTASDTVSRALRDLRKRRFEEALAEAERALAAVQRLLADAAWATEIFGDQGVAQLKACLAEVRDTRAKLAGGKPSLIPADAMVGFSLRLSEAESVLLGAVPIIKRSSRT